MADPRNTQTTITIWQIKWATAPGGWRFATPEDAAMVACVRPGESRIVDAQPPRSIKFYRVRKFERPGLTERRLAAAKKALRRQRELVPLFAGHVAAEQPTPEERVEQFDANLEVSDLEFRENAAAKWRQGRAILAALPFEAAGRFRFRWNTGFMPHNAEWFLFSLRRVVAKIAAQESREAVTRG